MEQAFQVDKRDALNRAINRLVGEKDDIDDDLRTARDKIAELEKEATPAKQKVTTEEMARLTALRCAHCGGSHTIACPRVKRIRFRPDGQSPAETEFWADDQWPHDDVVWLETLIVEDA